MGLETGFTLYEYETVLTEGVFRHPQGQIVFAGRYTNPTVAQIISFLEDQARSEPGKEYVPPSHPRNRAILRELIQRDEAILNHLIESSGDIYRIILQKFIPKVFPENPSLAREHLLLNYGILRSNEMKPTTLIEYQKQFQSAWYMAIILNEGELPTIPELRRGKCNLPVPLQPLKVSDTSIPRKLVHELQEEVYLGNHEAEDIAALPDQSAEVLYLSALSTLRNAWSALKEFKQSEELARGGSLMHPATGMKYEA